jgi:Na+-transporting methylmalonyl-CoA/oxaloacetate decarboxylase gamma subunit
MIFSVAVVVNFSFEGSAVVTLVLSVLWFLVWFMLFNLSFQGSAVLTLVSSVNHTKNHRTDNTRVNTALPSKHRLNNTDHTKNHRTDNTRVNTALPSKLRLNNTDHTKNHRMDDTRVNIALPWKLRDWTTRTTLKITGWMTQGLT